MTVIGAKVDLEEINKLGRERDERREMLWAKLKSIEQRGKY